MYQNKIKRYLIPIDWNYRERWVIDLEFNEKEQLYAIWNDGLIYKIDILTQKVVPKKSSDVFKNQPIVKAKLVEKGFIALTVDGNFYYSKDIKNPIPKLIFPISLLHFTNNVEFLPIPSSKSKSKKLELLIINQKGDGVIHIEETEGEAQGQFCLTPIENEPGKFECKGASIIIKNQVETYYLYAEEKNEPEVQEPGAQYEKLGKIVALAISPDKDQLAIYDPRGFVFFFYINFEEGGKRRRANININGNFNSDELLELQKVINFEEGCQFLYCGKDAVAVCGFRFIFLINTLGITLIFKITDEIPDPNLGASLCKYISEVDGIRYLTNEGVFFIVRVSKELVEISDPFVDSKNSCPKLLLEAYLASLDKKTKSEKLIREIKFILSDGINNLQIAAANLFWTKSDKNEDKKNIQLFILEAAQHTKCFVKKDIFNFDKFYEMCKDIRTINNLRNSTKKPKLITYNEYRNLEKKDLILKIIRSLNFGLAFKITQYLEYDINIVYEKYSIACIKQIADRNDTEEENKIFEMLNKKLQKAKNFSFINLAKKAFKYHKDIIGMKFLENEKLLLAKLPKYIDKEEWDKALELSENIYDSNIKMSILEKAFKKTALSDFIKIVGKHPKLKTFVIEFLKSNAPEKIDDYMELLKSPEEMFFFVLEQYFPSGKFSDRKKYIKLARENEKLIDNTINPNFEHKFYKNYLDSLEFNLSLKIECLNLDRTVIQKAEETSFDISIYDTYKYGIKAD